MKFLKEIVESVNYLEEETGEGKKSLFITGPFLQGNITNRNQRFYPFEILQNETARYIKENVNSGRAYGELGHPNSPAINLDRVAGIIKELRQDGTNYIGKMKIIEDNPMGLIAKNLIREGAKLGVSSRALGSLKPRKDGINEVQNDLSIKAIDIVADPSAPDAWVTGLYESKEWVWNGMEWVCEELKNRIDKQVKRLDEEKMLAFFDYYLSKLSNK